MDYAGIDFLSIRLRSYSSAANVICNFLGLDEGSFILVKGRYGYKQAYQHGNIHVYFNGREEIGFCVEMSGRGCREYISYCDDDYALIKLLACLNKEDAVTRIDVDLHHGAHRSKRYSAVLYSHRRTTP